MPRAGSQEHKESDGGTYYRHRYRRMIIKIEEVLACRSILLGQVCNFCRRAEYKISDIEGGIQAAPAMKRSLKKRGRQCQKLWTLDHCPMAIGLAPPQCRSQ